MTRRTRRCSFNLKRDHQSSKSREGDLQHQASQGYVWFRLTMIRVCFLLPFERASGSRFSGVNGLSLSCADICKVLDRGLNGRRLDELSQSVLEAIQELWPRLRERSSSRADRLQSPGSSVRRTIKRRSPVGSWTSIGPLTSSVYVQSAVPAIANRVSNSDRTSAQYPHDGCRYSS